jgi:hypothetical protein
MVKAPTVVIDIIILVNIEMVLNMAKASILGLMGDTTRVIGKITNYMEKASILGLLVTATRVRLKMVKCMGMAL